MKLLSLHVGIHDNSCCYFDGEFLHYYKSERKYKKKHHAYNSLEDFINDIKSMWNVEMEDIDQIAITGMGYKSERFGVPSWDGTRFFPASSIDFFPYHKNVVRPNHHYSHTLSTNIVSRLNEDISFVIDGEGQKRTWSIHKNNAILDDGIADECGSIGKSMVDVGYFLGIQSQHHDDVAGKLMGLQSYGKLNQDYYEKIKHFGMRDINEIFSYDNWKKYNYQGYTDLDWIHTVHERVGDLLVEFFSQYANANDVIRYSGGVAQNIIWNTKLKQKFPNLIIGPHSSDEGLSIGNMEYLRIVNNLPPMSINNFPYSQKDESPDEEPTEETIKIAAKLLSEGKIIAWYQGNGEIGPRALGNRSILMDPRIPNGKDKVNSIKHREQYRPFGASILEEHVESFFDVPFKPFINPHMLYVVNAKDGSMPAITHVDSTCRLQTVKTENKCFRKLLEEFYKLTGCPAVLNTSLNLAGNPIADTIDDAVLLYKTTPLDALFVGNRMFLK